MTTIRIDEHSSIDTNKVERVKQVYGEGPNPSIRVFYEDSYQEFPDPDGHLLEQMRGLGIACS